MEDGESLYNLHGTSGHRRSTELPYPITGDQGKIQNNDRMRG